LHILSLFQILTRAASAAMSTFTSRLSNALVDNPKQVVGQHNQFMRLVGILKVDVSMGSGSSCTNQLHRRTNRSGPGARFVPRSMSVNGAGFQT